MTALHCVRLTSQITAETAHAVLSGSFWYRDYGLSQSSGPGDSVRMVGLLQQRALPLLERLAQLLELQPSLSPSTCPPQHISDLSSKQMYSIETCSRVWTASVPVVKGISTQSLREPIKTQNLEVASAALANGEAESPPIKEPVNPTDICVPTLSEGEWEKLLELSPLFQLLKGVEQQLRGGAEEAGLLKRARPSVGPADKGNCYVDVLDAQWVCEGELTPVSPKVLDPQEMLVYQHGLHILETLHALQLTPMISLQVASSLPTNNYYNNTFRNSFFYQDVEETLFVRRQRLHKVRSPSSPLSITRCRGRPDFRANPCIPKAVV
ncbi:uncharacterized protein FYW47_003095 [Aplochiton taeniatus]